jgi:hypothetical protein
VAGSLSNVPRLVVALTLLTVDPPNLLVVVDDDDDDDDLRGVVPRKKAEEKIGGGGGVAWWANIIKVPCDWRLSTYGVDDDTTTLFWSLGFILLFWNPKTRRYKKKIQISSLSWDFILLASKNHSFININTNDVIVSLCVVVVAKEEEEESDTTKAAATPLITFYHQSPK